MLRSKAFTTLSSKISNSPATIRIHQSKRRSLCRSATLARTTGLTQCEDCLGAHDILLRIRIIARRDLRGDRLAGADGVSASKRAASFGITNFKWTLRTPDQDRFIHDFGEGADTLLEPVWENC